MLNVRTGGRGSPHLEFQGGILVCVCVFSERSSNCVLRSTGSDTISVFQSNVSCYERACVPHTCMQTHTDTMIDHAPSNLIFLLVFCGQFLLFETLFILFKGLVHSKYFLTYL